MSWRGRVGVFVCSAVVAGCQAAPNSTFAIPTAQIPGPTQGPSTVATAPPASVGPVESLPPGTDWPMYLANPMRTAASTEHLLTTASVAQLTTKLKVMTGGPIASSPAIVGGIAYIGSGDGYEYSIDLVDGHVRWKTLLGQTSNGICYPKTMGVTSSAAVLDGIVYVGGGDRYWFALSADTGKVLWRVSTGDNAATDAGGHYNWSSPLVWKGSAYIGIASFCDNPSVRGQLLRVDLTTHRVVATFNVIREGQRGGGIWTSPSIDPATNTVYVTTGETTVSGQPRAQSMIALDADSLAVRSSWQLPSSEAVAAGDSDWSTTPTIFSDGARDLVAAGNKNGVIYAFDRRDIAAGPVWRRQMAVPGQCGVCAEGTFASMAFSGDRLFAGGGATATINGTKYDGSVRALDPATGKVLWEQGLPDAVIPAVAYDNGVVVVAAGSTLSVFSAADGTLLFSAPESGASYGAPSISRGRIVLGLLDGNVWVVGTS